MPHTHALSVAAKDALTIHRRELSEALRPAGNAAASQRIARLFQMFPLIAVGENIEKLVENYTKAVASMPLWAIDQACVEIQRSGAEYRPAEPKFIKAVLDAAQPKHVELEQIEAVLNADIYRVPDPEERDRVQAKFRALIGEVGLGQPIDNRPKPETKQQAQARVAEGFSDIRTAPLVVSDALGQSNAVRDIAILNAERDRLAEQNRRVTS